MKPLHFIQSKIRSAPLGMVLCLFSFLFGLFFEFTVCLASVVLLIWLLWRIFRQKKICFSINISFCFLGVTVLFYLFSVFWAADRGMAVFGFFKFLPVLLFALVFLQYGKEEREDCMEWIPWSGAIMTVLSGLFSFVPVLRPYFTVSDRLAGFFQYPNTFALFLLLGLIVLATRTQYSWCHLILAIFLLFGIFASGSRTVFVLTIFSALCVALFGRNRVVRKTVLLLLPAGIVLSLLAVWLTGNVQTVGRYLTTSLSSSTFLGRLLYFQDALPVILQNPFGLGYEGYYYAQSAFQTGVYTVKYVHNDFLQLLLDVGWIPTGLFLGAVAYSFFKKGASLRRRLLLLAICAHCLFDFSLQYAVIFMILAAVLDYGALREASLQGLSRSVLPIAGGVMLFASFYFGLASFLAYLGNHTDAVSLYPAYTDSYLSLLEEETDIDQAHDYAEKILSLNSNIAPVYDIQALYAYSQGDFSAVIANKETSLALAPYSLNSYTEYIDMLAAGMQAYAQNGDFESAQYCRETLKAIPGKLKAVQAKTSPLAWKIQDTPQLELPAEYQERLASLIGES